MSAAFDLDIFRIFMAETGSTGFETEAEHDNTVRGALLYVCLSMADGSYCDFQFSFNAPDDNTYYKPARTYLDALKCRPLLQPWLEDRQWTRRAVLKLKTIHLVTQTLTNKD